MLDLPADRTRCCRFPISVPSIPVRQAFATTNHYKRLLVMVAVEGGKLDVFRHVLKRIGGLVTFNCALLRADDQKVRISLLFHCCGFHCPAVCVTRITSSLLCMGTNAMERLLTKLKSERCLPPVYIALETPTNISSFCTTCRYVQFPRTRRFWLSTRMLTC